MTAKKKAIFAFKLISIGTLILLIILYGVFYYGGDWDDIKTFSINNGIIEKDKNYFALLLNYSSGKPYGYAHILLLNIDNSKKIKTTELYAIQKDWVWTAVKKEK